MDVRVKVIYGPCYGDPPTIVVLPVLGGGGVQNNYYVNLYKKDSNNNCHTVNTMPQQVLCSFPAGTTKKITVVFSKSSMALTKHTEFGYLIFYGAYKPYQLRIIDFINAISGFGRVFQVTDNKVEIYMTPSDPLYNTLTVSTLDEDFPEKYKHVQNPEFCPPPVINTKQVCGWQPISGGVGVFQYTVPPVKETYLVEVTDEFNTTSTVVVEIDIQKPQFCVVKTKNASLNGKLDGELDADLPQFGGPFKYEWYDSNNNLISTNKKVFNIGAGNYCLNLINKDNCVITCCGIVIEPEPLLLNFEYIKKIDCDNDLAICKFTLDGGLFSNFNHNNCGDKCLDIGPYTYSFDRVTWHPTKYDNTFTVDNLKPGIHTLYIKDCDCNIFKFDIEVVDNNIKIDI
jgi:hypothetical protein